MAGTPTWPLPWSMWVPPETERPRGWIWGHLFAGYLVGGLEHGFYFSIYWEESSQLTNSTTNRQIFLSHANWWNRWTFGRDSLLGSLCFFRQNLLEWAGRTDGWWNWIRPTFSYFDGGSGKTRDSYIYIYISMYPRLDMSAWTIVVAPILWLFESTKLHGYIYI